MGKDRDYSAPRPNWLDGLVRQLPSEGEGWSEGDRARWLAALTALLDLSFPVEEETS